jgi:hypothetical protein
MRSMRTLPSTNLVDLHTDGALVHVEDDAGAAVVEVEGHALLDGAIHHDVHVVAALEGGQVPGHVGHALRAVLLRELVAGAMAVTSGE